MIHRESRFPVCVFYRNSPDGSARASFAADLHRRLNGDNGRLLVLLVQPPAEAELARRMLGAQALDDQAQRVAHLVMDKTALSLENIEVRAVSSREEASIPDRAIVVSRSLAGKRTPFAVMAVYSENSLECRGNGSLVIPFGAYESGKQAAAIGIPLAKALGKPVIFWHTTLKRPGLTSSVPAEHMREDSVAVMRSIESEATRQGVSFETVVEHAARIPEGIVDFAVSRQAALIVMARGSRTVRGCHVDQVLTRSSIPVLIARS